MVIREDVIVAKEIIPGRIWASGGLAGDETAADITLSGSAAVGEIFIGRQSVTSGNNTKIYMRSRANDKGVAFIPGSGHTRFIDNAAPVQGSDYGIVQMDSTTKGVIFPRLSQAQTSTLSGAATPTLSGGGLVWFDTTKMALCYLSGNHVCMVRGVSYA